MTIVDYLLIGGVAAAAIYTVYRLFLGWRNSTFARDEGQIADELNAPSDPHVATGTPWNRRAKERATHPRLKTRARY